MDKKSGKGIKVIIVILAVLLGLSLLSLAGVLIYHLSVRTEPTSVVIPENIIQSEGESQGASEPPAVSGDATVPTQTESEPTETTPTQAESKPVETGPTQGQKVATALRLHSKNAQDNTPFYMGNMFPGDKETKYYCVEVSHKDTVTVRFRADIRPGYETLAQVLKVRVVLKNTGKTLYDGLMRDMPERIDHTLQTDKSTVSSLFYEISVYLETSVGNAYMEKELKADFRWWVEETGNLDPPETGDSANLMLWLGVMSVSLIAVILLTVGRRQREARNADR